MTESNPPDPGIEMREVGASHVVRRHYLIDRKRQLRTTLLTTSLVAVLLLSVNLGFALLRSSQTSLLAAAAPQLAPVLEEQNNTFSMSMALISVSLLAAVAAFTIMQTHRTAGAVYAVKQRLERLSEGDLQVALRLREHDNLRDLESPFNAMVAALRGRAMAEADTLRELAEEAGRIGPAADHLVTTLDELARHKRQVGT
jgi:methyl-accepting chemotaxis protein